MSGRDFKAFVASARSSDEVSFEYSMKYKPVNYEKLLQITERKKNNANRELQKLSEFKKKKLEHKDRNLLQKHQRFWVEYYHHLEKERKRLQIEVEIAWSDVSKNRIKLQAKETSQSLQHEQEMIQLELKMPSESAEAPDVKNQYSDIGIPEEAMLMEWPNKSLKEAILQEFLSLDNQYKERLNQLKEQHQQILKSRLGDWSEENHLQFVMLREQYPTTMRNRRKLLLDRIKRQLPTISVLEFDKHERWWIEYNWYHERRTELLHSWSRSRNELLIKSKALLADAWSNNEVIKAKEVAIRQQERLCQELHQKVTIWREQKLELLKLEEEMATKLRENEAAKLAAEVEQEQRKRLAAKDKVTAYKKDLEKKRREQEEADKMRLTELRKILAEQAVKDKARIEYRKEEHRKKIEDRRLAKEEVIRQEIEKEARLDRLRQKVEVHVENDPLRLLQPTEAYNAKTAYAQQESELQDPIFSVYGYTDDKILSDPRYKVEAALRTAGLLKSDYARMVLSTVTPLQPPRPDQETTMFHPSFKSI
ncbi:uncharacterized protein TRIADDRAFT_49953 [Trichoplax adhaerens]|uniref:Coiled-coil domain-containing protein 148 n=1 Tax=Trichoplax adhaerens TaxID=10228 RepID=B3RR25_TRIAD|nr:hypothetical protein TRIADDRAFT_49953 [Trichoplax adhaerens]EDV26267.1 hypothetical protein TRIADDRAFT_49953 [Trichoplax adhaerens]|eukprot:XP_002110263.1 hypothetical protein TRIADDRAFT_49953 [Trichoplax adhaerens]